MEYIIQFIQFTIIGYIFLKNREIYNVYKSYKDNVTDNVKHNLYYIHGELCKQSEKIEKIEEKIEKIINE